MQTTAAISRKNAIMNGTAGGNVLETPLSVVGCLLLYLFLLIENPLEELIPGLNYFDEVIFLGSLGCALIALWHRRELLDRRLALVVALNLTAVFLGLLGNFLCNYQKNWIAILSEIIAYFKFPIALISFTVLMRDVDRRAVIDGCALISKIFILICCIFCLINLLVPTAGFGHDVRNGIASFKFIFSHPTYLVLSLVISFVVVSAQDRSAFIWKVACLLVMLMTMRDKAFGFIALVIFFRVFNIAKRRKVIVYLLLAAAVVLFVAWPKIELYLSFSNSPRQALYTIGFQIACDSFPFGGGLGSFASSISGRYYSDAYFAYGLSNVIGMTPDDYLGFGDAGIPYYYSQFGFLGFALTIFAFYLLYRHVMANLSFGSHRKAAIMMLFGYLLIAVTVEAVFTNSSGLIAAILLSYLGSTDRAAEARYSAYINSESNTEETNGTL